MKRLTQIFILTMAIGLLSGCGKDMTSKSVTDVEATAKDEAKIQDESKETKILNSENQSIQEENSEKQSTQEEISENQSMQELETEIENQESEEATNADNEISLEELSNMYVDCICEIEKTCDTLDELAFATVDVNNDGIKELLYAKSSVNAAGVYVCFYDNGQIIKTGPFGCYGGIKYAPAEGKIISVMDNMDYMKYELINIDENYETDIEQKFEIEPHSEEDSYVYFLDDEEVTESEYSKAFEKLKSMDAKCLDYDDMFMYNWTTSDPDIIAQHLVKLLEEDEPSRDYHMIIPMEEKKKLVGTWEIYSSELEGEITYAKDKNINGKITVHEDYTVDLDYGRHRMNGMRIDFYNGSFNDYADNTDWYVVIDAIEEDGTTIYMNVSNDDQLTVNTISEGEMLVSLWDIYNRVK